jgi:urease accessory protein UreF
MSVNYGGPAHPIHELRTRGTIEDGDVEYVTVERGMTLRTYIASQVLSGVVAGVRTVVLEPEAGVTTIAHEARIAVAYADALLAELNKDSAA